MKRRKQIDFIDMLCLSIINIPFQNKSILIINILEVKLEMNQQCISIKIPNARQKLLGLFPEDPRGDFKVIFRHKIFKLQKAFLRLQSGFFKRKCLLDTTILQITERFNIQPQYLQSQIFTRILSCFYGARIQIKRNQMLNYYPIIKFLEIESLLSQLRKQMVQNIEHYDLFALMKCAHKYNEQQIFETCLLQLQKEGFEQMKYNTSDLFNCSIQLFKLIIKTHNRRKSQGGIGLQYRQVDKLIKQYCQSNNLGEQKYHEYKFELIDKTKLTSQEYKQIFLNQITKNRNTRQSFIKTDSNLKSNIQSSLTQSKPMYQSMIGTQDNSTYSNELTLQMQNIFQKKLNDQLVQEKSSLLKQLDKLKESTANNYKTNMVLQSELGQLKKKLDAKQRQQKQTKNKLADFESTIRLLQNSLMSKDKILKRLQQKVQKLSTMQYNRQDPEIFTQSQIIPANLLSDIMKKQQSIKPQQQPKHMSQTVQHSLDQSQIQQKYISRLEFDEYPISTPKTYLPILVDFLGTDGFDKKKLKLIFRRSDKFKEVGTMKDIRMKNKMVLLIRTGTDQLIGGYISASIPQQCSQYIQDPDAFIFNLGKGKKFQVKKSNRTEAIYLSQHYLISFGNDLMISKDCLNEESYCDWSCSYERNGNSSEYGPKWFAGGSEFMIRDLQFYEIQQGQMQMVL